MEKFAEQIKQHQMMVNSIIEELENDREYRKDMNEYLPLLNQMTTQIVEMVHQSENAIELNIDFLLQVLRDIIYGIEQNDTVFLLDVLKYGLLEIFDYIENMLTGESYE